MAKNISVNWNFVDVDETREVRSGSHFSLGSCKLSLATSYSSDTPRHYRRALAYVQPLIIESRVGRDKWCVGRVHFHRTRVKASAFRASAPRRRPIHSAGNGGRSHKFINDSRIRLLSSSHSINTIITIRVTGVTMTHDRRADWEIVAN